MSELQHVARTITTAAPSAPASHEAAPGKATRVGAGSGSTAGATPLEHVIAHAGETVHDDRGFSYLVRADGSFEVTGTPQQLVRSIGKVITPDGSYAARWREVASALIHAGAPLELPGPTTAAAGEASGGPLSPAAWFRRRYDGVAAGQPLARRLSLYDDFVTMTALKVIARNALPGDGAAISAGFEAFADALEAELVAELIAAPDGAVVWRTFVERHADAIASSPRLAAFRQRGEHQLLEHLAADAVAAAGPRGRELIDVQLRAIVANHRQDFYAAASLGVRAWQPPRSGADAEYTGLSIGSSLAGGVGSIFTAELCAGTVLAIAGVPLLVVGIGAGVAAAYISYQSAKDAHHLELLHDAIRAETQHGLNLLTNAIRTQEDVIAALIAAKALARGLDAGSLARGPLRDLAWAEMFGQFPADPDGIAAGITAVMKKHLDSRLGG